MGYTHYWYRPVHSEISQTAWDKIRADVSALIKAAPCKLAYEYDSPTKKPQIDDSCIRFNGVGDDRHETFLIDRVTRDQDTWRATEPTVFDFCKTAYKPYDQVVCGALACIAEHDSSVVVRSGGDLRDWQPALNWASETLNRKITFPVHKKSNSEAA